MNKQWITLIVCGAVIGAAGFGMRAGAEGSHAKDDAHKGSHAKSEADHGTHAKHDDHDHGSESSAVDGAVRITGEVLDMACYLDHGASGEGHKACAKTCIESGLPVGIKSTSDGKTYLVIGEHKPLNAKLAEHAAETITIEGKLVSRDGISMIANARVVE